MGSIHEKSVDGKNVEILVRNFRSSFTGKAMSTGRPISEQGLIYFRGKLFQQVLACLLDVSF